jgi:hypothetical protein
VAEAQQRKAEADAAEETVRKKRAETELELHNLRTEGQRIPIRVDETAYAVVNDVADALRAAELSLIGLDVVFVSIAVSHSPMSWP